jgi:hypothetical protein
MRFVRKACGVILATSLIFGSASILSGCDSGSQSNQMKPIDSNILKKLGQANQSQTELAKTKAMEKMQKKK